MKRSLRNLLLTVLAACLTSSAFCQINFSRFVTTGTDDAEEYAPGTTGSVVGTMDLASSDVELMVDGTKQQYIGIRFGNVNIPNGATIVNAYIQFATKGDKAPVSGAITIKCENVDNSSTFTSTSFNISTRPVTTGSVTWAGSTSTTWGTTAGGTRGADQRTPTLATIVQSIVNRTGWASGNALSFVLSGSGVRNAYSYDGSSTLAPELIIQYTNPNVPMSIINFPIPKNSEWYYLDNGTDMSTTWIPSSFNHSAWQYGPGKLGYSDNPATTISYGTNASNKYITSYFRKQFTVASVSALTDTLVLGILRDDGAIIYINGVEAVRSNLPTGTVNYQTWSSTTVDNTDESTYFQYRISKSFLVNGQNTIAVEVHQRDGTSSDLGFDLELKEEPVPSLIRGPYLQKATSTSMNVRWRTDAPGGSVVYYGTHPDTLNSYVSDSAFKMDHELTISSLIPRTRYYYEIRTLTNTLQGDTNNYFQTLPVPGSTDLVRIGVIGDCGNNSTNQVQVRNQLKNYLGNNYMDSWILLGDNAYSSGTENEFQASFFNIYRDGFLKQNPLFPAPGNHDYSNGSSTAQDNHNIPYYSMFTMPTNGESGGIPSNNEAYYSFDIGTVHFLSLDSYGEEDAGTTRLYDTLGAQVQWIKADLAANTNKGWIVAYWHHPPYTKGSHNSDTETELVRIRENFIKILERNGVDLVLCGHSHDYERSKLQKGHYGAETTFNATQHNVSTSSAIYDGSSNSCPYIKDSATGYQGTVYVVSGSAGQLGGTTSGYPHNAMQYSNATNGGSMILEVQGNRLDAKWICADGVIRDKFTMMKDVNKVDTTTVFSGVSDTLTASWTGTYAWNSGATTQSINIAPNADTLITVKDNTTSTCLTDSHLINVVDSPSYTSVPTAITQPNDPASCAAIVAYTVVATGIPSPVLSYTFTGATTGSGAGTGTGSVFNGGITTVTVTAINAYGSADTSFTVTVNDTELPAITAPANVAVNADNGSCDAAVMSLGTPVTSDNCGVATITNDAPAVFATGATTVTWTATDANGNSATATQTVTVTDIELPTITAPVAVTVNSDPGQCYATSVPLGTPVTTDNCTIATVINDAGNTFNAGVNTIAWTVTDANGNIATAMQTVTVVPLENSWIGVIDSLWSNVGNWSCNALPGATTNVTIPSSAPHMPLVDMSTAICNALTIDNGAQLTFTGQNNALEIKGSVVVNGTFNAISGGVILSGTASQSLPGTTYASLEIDGGSNKTLLGNASVTGALQLTNGHITLGAHDLVLSAPALMSGGNSTSFVITNGAGSLKAMNMGAGGVTTNVTFPVGTNMNDHTPVSLNNTGVLDNYTVRVIDGVYDTYNGNIPNGNLQSNNAVNKTWLISEDVTGGSVSTVAPYWNASNELPMFDRNLCYVSHYSTTANAWQPGAGGTATGNDPYTHSMTVNSFSPFGVGSASSPLDVRLLNFMAQYVDPVVNLVWSTSNERRIKAYGVERSVDGTVFTHIGELQAKGSEQNVYSFTDKDAKGLNTDHIYYRLNINNSDGNNSYSKVQTVVITDMDNSIVVTPNPVSGVELFLNIPSGIHGDIDIELLDIQGKEVSSVHYADGTYNPAQLKVDVSGLASGVYMLRLGQQDNAIKSIRFTKQ
jgi:hypothetical protein